MRIAAKAAPTTPATTEAVDRLSAAPEEDPPAGAEVELLDAEADGMDAAEGIVTVTMEEEADVAVGRLVVADTVTDTVPLAAGADCPTM